MDDLTAAEIVTFGYIAARRLPSGEWLALGESLFTRDLYRGIDRSSWREKWMYEDRTAAAEDFAAWDGEGDPPGPWVKAKPSERWNPKRNH